MDLFPDTLCLNGTEHRVQTLLQATRQACLPGIESEVMDFLNQWYGPENTITVHTSGSTGPPKAISLEKSFVAQSAGRTLEFFELNPGQSVLLCLPLKYIAGKLMVVRALLGGLDLCTVEPADDFALLSGRSDNPFRFAAMVPNQVTKLLAYPERFDALDILLIGGSALPATLETKLQTVPTTCFASYGMTETATHIALRRINGPVASDLFHCLRDISVALSPSGCLTIEMPGLNTSDGAGATLTTNDLAELVEGAAFRILGRADNVIISGGVKYFPEIIEKKLDGAIEQPFFIGSLPDEVLGRRMVVVIEAMPDNLLEKRVAQRLVQYLDPYERPKKIVFKKPFKRTETGKILRQF